MEWFKKFVNKIGNSDLNPSDVLAVGVDLVIQMVRQT